MLHEDFSRGGLPCQKLSPGPAQRDAVPLPREPAGRPSLDRYPCALTLVRELAQGHLWRNENGPWYPRYAFPRSRMLQAIEDALDGQRKADLEKADLKKPDGDGPAPPPNAGDVLDRLGKGSWIPARSGLLKRLAGALLSPASLVPALLVAAVSALLAHLAVTPLLAFSAGTLIVAAVILAIRQNLGPLSWLSRASLWFVTTTFLVPAVAAAAASPSLAGWWRGRNPRRSWLARKARTRLVIQQLSLAQYGPRGSSAAGDRDRAWQFYLQLRVLALLEDLRANYRPWTLDLRRRKRTCPPVAFLAHVTESNGGLPLLRAISDVHSRRSEQDPLLVVAGVPVGEDVEHRRAVAADRDDGTRRLYETWVSAMGVDQSPSRGSAWPWVLRPRLAPQAPGPGPQPRPVARQPRWAPLWPYPALAAVLVAAAGLGIWQNWQDCGDGLGSAAHDLVRSPLSPGQCVGIDTTNSTVFVPAGGGPRLTGAGAGVTLAAVERGIIAQNQVADAGPHVTIVYAGALTSSAATGAGQAQAAGAAGELAGAYAWQRYVNTYQAERLRIDIANGGQDLASQVVMARKIAVAARQDPTIVGVIGLGRDTPTSQEAVQDLASAGLPVVDTTNSDDSLAAGNWNYFGLGATNGQEAAALRSRLPAGHGQPAVILERDDDRYSSQQAAAARAMLTAAGYQVLEPPGYPAQDDHGEFHSIAGPGSDACAARPAVVYLAGRSDDLPNLLYLMQSQSPCFAGRVTVISGDDLTKYGLPGAGLVTLPSYVRIFYAAQTDVGQTGPGSGLLLDLQRALGVSVPGQYCNALFSDGTVALSFDAAQVLYEAVSAEADSGDGWGRAGVPTFLRLTPLTSGATGPIALASARHAIAIVELTPSPLVRQYRPAAGPAPARLACAARPGR